MTDIRLATRQSQLALWQAHYVKQALERAHPGLQVEIVGMSTEGDRNKQDPLVRLGGKGVFVKELETGLLDGSVDIAVHSMKDVPAVLPDGLHISAICEREDPRDAFLSSVATSPEALPPGARVGSSSLRRRYQLMARRPDLTYVDLRGNVDTRLKKLDAGECDAIILAVAGLKRLGLEDRVTQAMDTGVSIPAAGQGAVGIEARIDDQRTNDLLAAINHDDTALCVTTEREISGGLGASCTMPLAAFAEVQNGTVSLVTYVASLDGKTTLREASDAPAAEALAMARDVVQRLRSRGAEDLVRG